jgi:hypothetical protein
VRSSLGRPNALGINTDCGKALTQVAWHDLIVEFRSGRFSGYRVIRGDWPLTTQGSPRDRIPGAAAIPPLCTRAGVTSGRLRSASHPLARTAALRWTASNGLTFTVPSTSRAPAAPTNRTVAIQTGTCGDF